MTPAYSVKDLTFAYGGTQVLDVSEMEVRSGEIVALVGPNGSGKTTLLNLLAFVEMPASGTIHFFGEAFRTEETIQFRRRVGFMLQQPYLFHTSILANITWGLHLRGVDKRTSRERALAALERVGLAGFEHRSARALSGGQAQLVALARTLALDPEVFLLDEPASHIDHAGIERTEEIIVEMNRTYGKTVVLTTHDLPRGQRLAHRVFHLFRGKLVRAFPENLFRGELTNDGATFRSNGMSVRLPVSVGNGTYMTIDPEGITISADRPTEAALNAFEGRIVALAEINGHIRVEVEAGERFNVRMSPEEWRRSRNELGQTVWVTVDDRAISVLP